MEGREGEREEEIGRGGERNVAVNTKEGRDDNGMGDAMGEVMGKGRGGRNMRVMEGERDVEGKGMDGGGDGGRRKGANLTRRELIARREPLRGKRRGPAKSIPEGEKEMMAQCMKRWLGVSPHRTTKNYL